MATTTTPMTIRAWPDRAAITVPETAELLGISVRHAYKLCRAGVIPSVRLGYRVVVPTRQLARFIEEQSHGEQAKG